MIRICILSVKERPADIEKILENFKLTKKSINEWIKDGITIMGGSNNMSGESRFTIRIKSTGVLPQEEQETLRIYNQLKEEYKDKILSAYTI